MNNSDYQSYCLRFLLLSSFLLCFLIAFNWIIDPADIYRVVQKKGFNEIKPKVTKFTRISKPIQTQYAQPKTLVLGSSRAEFGVNMSDAIWKQVGLPAINNAVSGASVYDISRFYDHALAVAPVETIVLGIDFFMFNVFAQGGNGIKYEEIFAVSPTHEKQPFYNIHQLIFTLLSADFFSNSISTIKKQKEKYRKFTPEGQRINEREIYQKILPKGGFNLRFFQEDVREFSMWGHCRDNRFRYEGNGMNAMESFEYILETSRKKDIKLVLFIAPVHAWLLETIDALGFWGAFENWKRDLVKRVVQQNKNLSENEQSIELWDFTGYSSYTTEPVPEKNDNKTVMKWYIDPSHYSDKLGHVILQEMFNQNQSLGFGIKLTPENIEQHLKTIRDKGEQFRLENKQRLQWVRNKSSQVLEKQRQFGNLCP